MFQTISDVTGSGSSGVPSSSLNLISYPIVLWRLPKDIHEDGDDEEADEDGQQLVHMLLSVGLLLGEDLNRGYFGLLGDGPRER